MGYNVLEAGDTQVRETTSWPRLNWLPLRRLFNRQYWWATLVVLLGMAFLARLGIWQLDRLEQRKARNADIIQQMELPPLLLTDEPLPEELTGMKIRRATARGEFDFSNQIALLYQNWMDAPGIHLITPLVIEGTSQAVLVDRGWLPVDQAALQNWSQFDEPGPVSVTGFIRLSQTLPARAGETLQTNAAEPLPEWYRVDIQAIQGQMPYELLPIYILESPPEGRDMTLPYEVEPELDLSDGPHLGYAIQWFIFAFILGIMYVRYVGKKETDQVPPGSESLGVTEET
jgi:surfeit locus 1 family protein